MTGGARRAFKMSSNPPSCFWTRYIEILNSALKLGEEVRRKAVIDLMDGFHFTFDHFTASSSVWPFFLTRTLG